MKCNHGDCSTCPYETCLEDDLTAEEIAMSEWLDNIAEKENEVDSSAVIRTGKRGRPKKLFPKYESETYKKEQLEKKREYYYKHKAERLEYQRTYYAEKMKNPAFRQERKERSRKFYQNLSEEEKAEYHIKRREYYRKYKAKKAQKKVDEALSYYDEYGNWKNDDI